MNLLKAIFLALKDVFTAWSKVFALLVDLFWCLAGIVALVLNVLLFPFIVWNKYKIVSNKKCKCRKLMGVRK